MGFFISFEGQEGAGKSTMVKILFEYLINSGFKKENIILTREPGGCPISEEIRNIVKKIENSDIFPKTEALLFLAARSQLVFQIIQPALELGKIVICDRFIDSTIAYQGFANGIDIQDLYFLNSFSSFDLIPDLTFLLKIDPEIGLSRKKKEGYLDRIENKNLDYHKKIQQGYEYLEKKHKDRIISIDATQDLDQIFNIIKKNIDIVLKKER